MSMLSSVPSLCTKRLYIWVWSAAAMNVDRACSWLRTTGVYHVYCSALHSGETPLQIGSAYCHNTLGFMTLLKLLPMQHNRCKLGMLLVIQCRNFQLFHQMWFLRLGVDEHLCDVLFLDFVSLPSLLLLWCQHESWFIQVGSCPWLSLTTRRLYFTWCVVS